MPAAVHLLTALAMVASAVGAIPMGAQQSLAAGAAAAPLVFDGVTVVDVEQGKLVPDQRVVVTGTRIQAVGAAGAVKTPKGAQLVDAHGKYLIPGLWDLHTHAMRSAELFYPLFLAYGVTGIRDAGSSVPLDTLQLWRREVLAGARVGPPRQLLVGRTLEDEMNPCDRGKLQLTNDMGTCVGMDTADVRHVVDSLHAAGADMIKMRVVDHVTYFAVAAEARRVGIPFGGHINDVTAIEAADSGARLIDHFVSFRDGDWQDDMSGITQGAGLDVACWALMPSASVEACGRIAEQMRQHGTWMVPTLSFNGRASDRKGADAPRAGGIVRNIYGSTNAFWSGSAPDARTLREAVQQALQAPQADGAAADDPASRDSVRQRVAADSLGAMRLMRQVGIPIVAGTDQMGGVGSGNWRGLPGFSLHAELTMYVMEGLAPAEALRTATLNPAKMLQATDSLGTVAAGKLADLVLLDADPLRDITNTAAIRAVVANGRYYDRAALDQVLADVRAKAKRQP